MKYIIVRDRQEQEHAIVFPDSLIHRDVARVHSVSNLRVVSAGFCAIGPVVSAWGESETLKMKSRPEDAVILEAEFAS